VVTVYVDNARIPYRNMRMSHLFADTEEELHEFAERLGLKREWFQPRAGRKSHHYDVSDSKREQAFALGAVALDYPRDVAEWIAGRGVFV
jgi:hypothetical protein